MGLDLSEQLTQFQKSIEYSGADGLLIPPNKMVLVQQLVLHYGKYTAYSGKIWHELLDCPGTEIIRSAGANYIQKLFHITDGTLTYDFDVPTYLVCAS